MNQLHELVRAATASPAFKNFHRTAYVDFETFYRTKSKASAINKAQKKAGLPPVPHYSVKDHGNWAYCQHPEFDAYFCTIWSPGDPERGIPEVRYAGDPRFAPWQLIVGFTWWSHNRNFDRHVYERLVELGIVKDYRGYRIDGTPVQPWSAWHDSADLAVYCHLPRALGNILASHFKVKLDKDVRADMDGRRFQDLTPEEQARLSDYALDDVFACFLVVFHFLPSWPPHEQELSLHTGNIEFRGIPVNTARVDKDLEVLEAAVWKTRNRIPWVDTEDEDTGKPFALRSKKALDRECLKCGVPPPVSTAQKSKDFLDWLDEYGERVPAIYELSRFRRISRAISVYQVLKSRIRSDGRAALALKYGGADKTFRWSGGSGFNLQNLMKAPLAFDDDFEWLTYDTDTKLYERDDGHTFRAKDAYLVDIRACLTASPGHRLLIPDLSQIEPRVLNWVVKNKAFLDACAAGQSPYEAHARASMGWTGGDLKAAAETDPNAAAIYALAKARVLALGYGAGWQKFIEMARGYLGTEAKFLAVFAKEPTPEQTAKFLDYLGWLVEKMKHKASKTALAAWPELDKQTQNIWVNSWVQVTDFRKTNAGIKSLWDRMDADFKASHQDGVFENELPSGRTLNYYDINTQYGWGARPGNRLAVPGRVYGGLLVENMIQGISRDVFGHGILNLEKAGYRVLFHVHDECIIDAPANRDVNEQVAEVKKLLCSVPDWCKSLPVSAGCPVSDHYKK